MNKKFTAAVLSLLMALGVMVSLQQPAQAFNLTSSCNSHDRGFASNGHVCLSLGVERQADGTGVRLVRVQVVAYPHEAFDHWPSVAGYSLKVYNPSGAVVWSRTGNPSNIPVDGKTWTPSITIPGNNFRGVYNYKARLNNWNDADNQWLSVAAFS